MTEHKWLKFAGFLNECTYGLDHEHCPFKEFRGLDQYQRLEHLMKMDDIEAEQMMATCSHHQKECSPVIYLKQSAEWSMAVAI